MLFIAPPKASNLRTTSECKVLLGVEGILSFILFFAKVNQPSNYLFNAGQKHFNIPLPGSSTP
jgi:hypothetical protein